VKAMSTAKFSLTAVAIGVLVMAFAHWFHVDYLFFASYTILQFIVLATAWNILGGYCGYVNFGSAAFFALGAYSSVALIKFDGEIDMVSEGLRVSSIISSRCVPVLIVFGALVSELSNSAFVF
jgi:branched-chain amino acid transport system permease protein